ncbi:hypothetical protein [Streptomyces benahoarensis]|uniref:Uncharacterized protein n=1 Tax=Streptomyces benahoarensis TaxID=2595054 RepID=A0A553Z764_9ACTN|nr:hypothetical protein [Streptomyces benahoarensis]TSB19392.1 hypothetical protein FNJ62_22575 [Streptomyces benahoarensis]TSB37267.1 hypothetical protein FNZ23_18765 [Streptomyces benahoarensis]
MTGYFAEVRCEGRPFGSSVTASHVLGTFRTISPVLAVRWLRGQARYLAERLDPDPERAPWAGPVGRAVATEAPDSPADLRAWAADPAEEHAARDHLKRGGPLFVTVQDTDGRYTLSVWPVRSPADVRPPLHHRIGGLAHPLYVLAEDPWR